MATNAGTGWLAVSGPGSWGGAESKVHAADPSTATTVRYDSMKVRYVSRCGVKYLTPYLRDGEPMAFGDVMHLAQCQRCVRLVAREGRA